MWERLRSIWTIPDLRKKILFTLVMLLVFRVLAHIPVPLTHTEEQALANLFSANGNQNLSQLLGLLDVFSGGSLQQFSIVALGVYPYITATIVMQLLMPIIPALENMNREGEAGRLRFSQITRIVTVPLAFLQALGNTAIFVRYGVLTNFSLFDPKYALESWAIVLSLVVGTAQRTYIPMQVNSAGMIPLIFAQSMLIFPAVLAQYLAASNTNWLANFANWIGTYIANTSTWYYWAIYFVLVVAFTYFYAYVVWQQQNIPETLQKQGAHIPGYRPGEATRKHLNDILNRVTLGGALFLGTVAILPFFARVGGNQLLSSAAVLIVVGVVLDTVS